MSDNQFVDTNILVYAHDSTAGDKHEQAKTLVQTLWDTRIGCLSVQVLQEFYVIVTRKVPRPLPSPAAAGIIENLSAWQVFAPAAHDVLAAINMQQQYQLSFWDAMIIWSAIKLDCRTLWSEDLNMSQNYAGVQVLNPFTTTP